MTFKKFIDYFSFKLKKILYIFENTCEKLSNIRSTSVQRSIDVRYKFWWIRHRYDAVVEVPMLWQISSSLAFHRGINHYLLQFLFFFIVYPSFITWGESWKDSSVISLFQIRADKITFFSVGVSSPAPDLVLSLVVFSLTSFCKLPKYKRRNFCNNLIKLFQ